MFWFKNKWKISDGKRTVIENIQTVFEIKLIPDNINFIMDFD